MIDVQKCKALNFSKKKSNSRKLQLKAKRNCWHIQFPSSKHEKKHFEEIFFWTNRNFLSKSRKRRKWSFVVLQIGKLLKAGLESNSKFFIENELSHFKQLHSHSSLSKNIPIELQMNLPSKTSILIGIFVDRCEISPFSLKVTKRGY